jgi:acetyltransferase-like isoleucine patch superfamily enzyme
MIGTSLHPLIPGQKLPRDWFPWSIPANIVAGKGAMINSSFCFKEYRARGEVGLIVGDYVTIWSANLSPEINAVIEIGDYSYIANASLACTSRITVGNRVFIAGGVTIVDCDFHPLAAAERLFDSIAVSPVGDRTRRPFIKAQPVIIEDDVWIGYNATILKGVRIGAGAVIAPGSVVTRDVEPNTIASGNPPWHS